MKLRYYYSNGKVTEHTTYISNKTMLKEAENSTKVDIYKITNKYNVNGEQKEEYITTLSLI